MDRHAGAQDKKAKPDHRGAPAVPRIAFLEAFPDGIDHYEEGVFITTP